MDKSLIEQVAIDLLFHSIMRFVYVLQFFVFWSDYEITQSSLFRPWCSWWRGLESTWEQYDSVFIECSESDTVSNWLLCIHDVARMEGRVISSL